MAENRNTEPESNTMRVSRMLGTSPSAIDQLQKAGLFRMPDRNQRGWCVWTEEDIERLRQLLERLKKAGRA